MIKTYSQKSAEIKRAWHLVDVQNEILGRAAVKIALLLIGKGKPTFTSHIDGGDFVVVTNAADIKVTRQKAMTKKHYTHSHQPGGLKTKSLGEILADNPTELIRKAVYNMLPKNKLRAARMRRLKLYAGAEHAHESQLNTGTKE